MVNVALETGLRKGKLLGLAWDRVDLSRGVIRLEVTKSMATVLFSPSFATKPAPPPP
jgi:integrase